MWGQEYISIKVSLRFFLFKQVKMYCKVFLYFLIRAKNQCADRMYCLSSHICVNDKHRELSQLGLKLCVCVFAMRCSRGLVQPFSQLRCAFQIWRIPWVCKSIDFHYGCNQCYTCSGKTHTHCNKNTLRLAARKILGISALSAMINN